MMRSLLLFLPLVAVLPEAAFASDGLSSGLPWWSWALLLFFITFLIGIFGTVAGIGGGVLFVPIVSSFFPFHIDFVRGAGLMIALASSIAAAPVLLKNNLASLKLAIPVALVASAFSIVGALVGLWLSAINPALIQGSLGVLILLIVGLMLASPSSSYPRVQPGDPLSQALSLNGIYHEPSSQRDVEWTIHRTATGLSLFGLVGFLAGLFGLGAGWANVPVLNLVMGAPLKVAVATSKFSLSITDTTAAWIYLNQGAMLPMLVIPSLAGTMLGARIGAKVLHGVAPERVRRLVIIVLLLAGARSLLKAFGI